MPREPVSGIDKKDRRRKPVKPRASGDVLGSIYQGRASSAIRDVEREINKASLDLFRAEASDSGRKQEEGVRKARAHIARSKERGIDANKILDIVEAEFKRHEASKTRRRKGK